MTASAITVIPIADDPTGLLAEPPSEPDEKLP
jgi:hypothetical protein